MRNTDSQRRQTGRQRKNSDNGWLRQVKRHKALIYILIIAVASLLSVTLQHEETGPPGTHNWTAGERVPATWVRAVDGDTFVVSIDGSEEKVRLLLIDTPESVKPNTPVQPFAKEASDFTKRMLEQDKLSLEFDVSERDRYGRLLAYAWVGDRMLNEMLLEEGYARVAYIYPPNVKYVDRFKEIQSAAQKAGIGIWSIEDYVQKDGFYPDGS